MKIFPSKRVTIQMSHNRVVTLDELRLETSKSEKLVSFHTDKPFIGTVGDSGFEVISSKPGRGAVCIFEGTLQDAIGEIEIRINKPIKILFSLLMSLPVAGLIVSIASEGVSLGIVVVSAISVLLIRYVYMERRFQSISKEGFDELCRITGMKEMK